jgi:hypothetical protein
MPEPRIQLSPRSPTRATLLSAFAPGTGQVYNKQLEKAVLFWIWYFIVLALGTALLGLGLLGQWLPSVRAPLSIAIAAHAGLVSVVWAAALFALWVLNIRDARVSAGRPNQSRRNCHPASAQVATGPCAWLASPGIHSADWFSFSTRNHCRGHGRSQGTAPGRSAPRYPRRRSGRCRVGHHTRRFLCPVDSTWRVGALVDFARHRIGWCSHWVTAVGVDSTMNSGELLCL